MPHENARDWTGKWKGKRKICWVTGYGKYFGVAIPIC